MIYTAPHYPHKLPSDSYPINISNGAPPFKHDMPTYGPLAPGWGMYDMLKLIRTPYDEDMTHVPVYDVLADMEKFYTVTVLDGLDPQHVHDELREIAGVENTPVLLAYDIYGFFSHRHIVANWLKRTLGVGAKEVGYNGPVPEHFPHDVEWLE